MSWQIYLGNIPATGGGGQTVTQSSAFINASVFYGGSLRLTISQGASFVNSSVFYGGAVNLNVTQTSQLINASVFYGGSVNLTVTQSSKYTNSSAFYGGAVLSSATITQSSIFVNNQTFYGGSVIANQVIQQSSSFINTQTFYGGAVSAGILDSSQSWYWVRDNKRYTDDIIRKIEIRAEKSNIPKDVAIKIAKGIDKKTTESIGFNFTPTIKKIRNILSYSGVEYSNELRVYVEYILSLIYNKILLDKKNKADEENALKLYSISKTNEKNALELAEQEELMFLLEIIEA